ncbi:MAG: T9SS type A sorting domain-containing protein, partial [Saprospiraceae bacterium]|nr:T9SS type A sorting domain-containing protein [Saprospiraceae bacterium]
KSISSVINQTVDLGAVQPILFAYPNPAIEEVRFDFNGLLPGNYDLKIYNILGQLVWERNFWLAGNRTEKVNLARLRKGTYLYSLVDSNGKTLATKRLMIVRP